MNKVCHEMLGVSSKFSPLFETDDADVLKLSVESPALEDLNKKLRSSIPHIETFFEYEPHIAVAYLKLGEGGEYDGKPIPGVSGKRVKLSVLTFSSKDGSLTDIPLGSGDQAQPTSEPSEEDKAAQSAQPQSRDQAR